MRIRTSCNICDGKKFKTRYHLKEFDILQCSDCHTLCRNTVFDKSENERLYGKDYFCNQQKDYFFKNIVVRDKAFTHKMSIINRLYPQKGKLLDLGCATGLFLKKAVEGGWDAEGVEFSEFAAQHARDIERLKVSHGDLIDMHFPAANFDVITMWDMIDHTESPYDIVKEAFRILKPGGILAMDTFMVDGLLFKIAECVYRVTFGMIKAPLKKGFPLHHSHYFSTQTFCYLLTSNGFEIIQKEGSYLNGEVFSLGYMGKKAVSMINWLSNYVGKKMEMVVIGRKPGRQV